MSDPRDQDIPDVTSTQARESENGSTEHRITS